MMQPLELAHKDRIEKLLADRPPTTSELSFPSLFAWRAARTMHVLDLEDGMVLISKKKRGLSIFSSPLGGMSLAEALEGVQQTESLPVIACERIPTSAIASLDDIGAEHFADRNNFDYVYRREDLAQLEGRRYHKKRNLIAQCLAENDCIFEPLSPELIPEIKEMQKRWCAQRDCGKQPSLCHENIAINDMLDHASSLDLIGGIIRIDGTVQAYTIASKLSGDTACVHFEKAMTEFKGLYQVINQQFAQNELARFAFVNREQDIGSPGIRQAKESYLPDHMVEKHVILHNIGKDEYEQLKTKETHCE